MKKLLALSLVVLLVSCNRNNKIGYQVPVVNPTVSYDNRSVGASANDLLSSGKYKAINIEFCYVIKHKLPDSVIRDAVTFLEKYCNKPRGVYVTQQQIPIQGGELYVNDLVTIEKIYRTKYEAKGQSGVDTLGIFVLVTEGDYYQKDILGVAYKNTSLALFDGIISANSDGVGQPSRTTMLSTVIKHELGHLLGLVDAGSEMQNDHLDEAHGKHCDNQQCLMHYKMQTKDILSVLTGDMIPVLDANCEADLKANGGK